MLIINNDLVSQLLTMEDCIRVQEEAFKKLPTGGAIHRPRIDMYFPCERPDGYFRWGTMEGANDGYFAIRMKSDIMTWPKDENGNWTEEKYCREPGTYCGIILLVSTRNAEPLAFINDGVLQHFRVGGGAGIGVKYLAREDTHVVGMLGSGGMARTFLRAFKAVRDIRLCKVYCPTPRAPRSVRRGDEQGAQHRGARGRRSARGGARRRPACRPAPTSMAPVYDADWIEPGMHVTNLGRREMPDDSADKFDVVIRQGTAGLQMKQTERFQAERGLSPAAFIGGTVEEMKRIPEKNPQPGFGGDIAGVHGSRQGRRQARLRRSRHRQGQGPHQPRPGDVLPQRRQPGPAVLLGRRLRLRAGGEAEEGPRDSDRVVPAGHPGLGP